ncbi:hypothetical protein FBF91_08265 [Campylobacter upsaliensis]|nr:hypothetical protein [Campylobacter upsaliensis]
MAKFTSRVDADFGDIEAKKAEEKTKKSLEQMAAKAEQLKDYIDLSVRMIRGLQDGIPDSSSFYTSVKKSLVKRTSSSLEEYGEKIAKLAKETQKLSDV